MVFCWQQITPNLLDGENTPQVFFMNHSVHSRYKAAVPQCFWPWGSLGFAAGCLDL